MLFVLDWGDPQSVQNFWPEILYLPVAISHFWDQVLCVEKHEVTNLFEAGYTSFLWLICGVPTLKCIPFGQFTCSVAQVLVWDVVLPGGWCTFCFYLVGRSSHCSCYLWWSCFILLTLLVVGCLWQGSFTAKLYLGGEGVLCPCYDEFWGGGTCGGFPWCIVKYFACVMVNSMFFYPAGMMNHFVCAVFWFYSLDDSGWFLCVVSLGSLWVPANLFLLHS